MLSIYDFERESLDCSEAYCHYKFPVKLLEALDLEVGTYFICAAMTFTFALIFRLIGYAVFVRRLQRGRQSMSHYYASDSCTVYKLLIMLTPKAYLPPHSHPCPQQTRSIYTFCSDRNLRHDKIRSMRSQIQEKNYNNFFPCIFTYIADETSFHLQFSQLPAVRSL